MTDRVPTLDDDNLTWPNLDKDILRCDPDIAWGAREIAAVMFNLSADATVNRARRRLVYRKYENYRASCAEALAHKRSPPPNPLGWIVMRDTNRIALNIVKYRAFVASHPNGANIS